MSTRFFLLIAMHLLSLNSLKPFLKRAVKVLSKDLQGFDETQHGTLRITAERSTLAG